MINRINNFRKGSLNSTVDSTSKQGLILSTEAVVLLGFLLILLIEQALSWFINIMKVFVVYSSVFLDIL